MKVAIDGTELAPGAPGGVRRALWLLLDALSKHGPGLDVTVFAPRPVDVPGDVVLQVTGGPARPLLWRRSRALRRAAAGVDVFHSPVTAFPDFRDGGPVVTATVHEIPFVAHRRLEGFYRSNAHWYWVTRAVTRCAVVFTPSAVTRDQVLALHPAAGPSLSVVPHPAPPTPATEQHEHDGSLLFVGRLDRRKRVEALLEGVALAPEGQLRLVGPHAETARERIEDVARRLGIERRVVFMGQVSEDMLDYLYRQAMAVGLVSASEGFGFPVLEALARGVPVLVARGTGAAETAGDEALQVDPTRPEEIAAALARAADPAYREHVRSRGPGRALEFTPARTARGYAEAFARALGD
ncbi:MAG: glycosyltransferase [Planctomycetota bacterium]